MHAEQQAVQYSGEVLSVLDELLGAMRTQDEKSYSAPFATHLYSKESVIDEDGEQIRTYPRLKYGGAHLEDISNRGADIALRSGKAVIQAVGITLLMLVVLSGLLARRWRVAFGQALRRITSSLNTDNSASREIVSLIKMASLLFFVECRFSGANGWGSSIIQMQSNGFEMTGIALSYEQQWLLNPAVT